MDFKPLLPVVFLLLDICEVSGYIHEARLHDLLFPNPDEVPTIPVYNSSNILEVRIKLYITQIIDVDERNQILTSKVWVKQSWNDYHLVWDPEDYGNISSLKVPNTYVWLPDILIYNNADGDYDIQASTWVNIKHDGTVTWFPPAVYKSSCQIDVTWYPFDEQTCKLKFGSWTHDGDTLNLVPDSLEAERKHYWPNGEWLIKKTPCQRHVIRYPCCEEPYVDVTYEMVLIRKPLFYFAYLLLPCGLISFNTLLVFYLPPDISEKMALCTNVLLSLAVFLLLITAQIPANANSFPLIVKYLIFTMIIVASSIVLTVYILNVRFRTPGLHKMPRWVRKVFLHYLPPFILIQRPKQCSKRHRNVGVPLTRDTIHHDKVDTNTLTMDNTGNNYSYRMRQEAELDHQAAAFVAGPSSEEPDPLSFYMPFNEDNCHNEAMTVHKTIEEVMYIAWQYKNQVDSKRDADDWKYLAMVIDRIFLIVYLLVVTIGTCVILFQAPHSGKFFRELAFDIQDYEWFEDPERNMTLHDYQEE